MRRVGLSPHLTPEFILLGRGGSSGQSLGPVIWALPPLAVVACVGQVPACPLPTRLGRRQAWGGPSFSGGGSFLAF